MRNAGDGRGPGWACPLLQRTVVPHNGALLPLSLHMLPSLSEMWSDWLLLEQHLVAYNIYPLEEKKETYYICTGQDLATTLPLILMFDISSNNHSPAPCHSPQSPAQLFLVPS